MELLDRYSVSSLVGMDPAGKALRLGAVGLALASGVGAWLELFLLRKALAARVSGSFLPGREMVRMTALALAAAVPAALLWWLLPPFHVILRAGAVMGIYAVLYLGLARLVLPEELEFWIGRFGRRLRR